MESRRKLISPGLAVTVASFVLVGSAVVALTRASGEPNPHHCSAGVSGALHPVLRAGDSDRARHDECVASLQWDLQKQGFKPSITGIFDDATVAAVKDFQVKNGLPSDGHVNAKAWVVLESGSN